MKRSSPTRPVEQTHLSDLGAIANQIFLKKSTCTAKYWSPLFPRSHWEDHSLTNSFCYTGLEAKAITTYFAGIRKLEQKRYTNETLNIFNVTAF